MDVFTAVSNRRSIRKYKDKPVPVEDIERLLELAVLSPSACDDQPWGFTVIEDRETIEYLSKKVRGDKGIYGRLLRLTGLLRRKDMVFYNAPLVILVSADSQRKWSEIDCGILAQTMFISACALGLGSCYIGSANVLNRHSDILKELGIPEREKIIGVLVFGYPAERKKTPARKVRILNWIK